MIILLCAINLMSNMKIAITENQYKNLKKEIIIERTSDSLLDERGYKAINDFEMLMGTLRYENGAWRVAGMPENHEGLRAFKGDKNTGVSWYSKSLNKRIGNHIENVFQDNFNTWFKFSPLYRMQIYNFMFNADSGPNDRYKWLATIAQAMNRNLNQRLRKEGKETIDFSNRKYVMSNINGGRDIAVRLIKQMTADEINATYENYKIALLDAYRAISSSNNMRMKAAGLLTWQYRPEYTEKLYKYGREGVKVPTQTYKNSDLNNPKFYNNQYGTNIKSPDDPKLKEKEPTSDTNIERFKKGLFNYNYKYDPDTVILQKILIKSGYDIGKYGLEHDGVDGKYGPLTRKAHELWLKNIPPTKAKKELDKFDKEIVDADIKKLTKYNFHQIPDGKSNFRSAELPENVLLSVIKKYKIKNVVRLNGEGGDSDGLRIETERNICKANNCNFKTLSAVRDQEQINDLLSQGNTLIHCHHGADRTGGNVGGYLYSIGWGDTKKIWDYTTQYNGWNRMVKNNPVSFEKGGYLRQAKKFGVKDINHAKELSNK